MEDTSAVGLAVAGWYDVRSAHNRRWFEGLVSHEHAARVSDHDETTDRAEDAR